MEQPEPAQHYRDLLRPAVRGRKWIVAHHVLAGATVNVELLQELGAEDVLVLTQNRGVGPVPPDGVRVVWLRRSEGSRLSMNDAIKVFAESVKSLSAEALAALHEFDAEGTALVWPELTADYSTVGGRQVYGARRREWIALEDKTIIDALWDAAGVRRAPREIVPVEAGRLARASAALDQGSGTVWVADNREGWHGGAEKLRWVCSAAERQEAVAFFAPIADEVRVMPFLEGMPCSIHGVVIDDDVVTLRPVEMVILRRREPRRLVYCGASTLWDPPAADRAAMRAAAGSVGEHLRAEVGYRGAFTVDGVLSRDGFLPTELNPRFGGGLMTMSRGIANLPLYALHVAITHGERMDLDPRAFEELLLASADRNRVGTALRVLDSEQPIERKAGLRWDGSRYHATDTDEPDATLEVGPGPQGGFLRFRMEVREDDIGSAAAPRAAAAFAVADELWQCGIGTLEPLPAVR